MARSLYAATRQACDLNGEALEHSIFNVQTLKLFYLQNTEKPW